jgi:hypothetical protein
LLSFEEESSTTETETEIDKNKQNIFELYETLHFENVNKFVERVRNQ